MHRVSKMTSLKLYKVTIDVTRPNIQYSFKHDRTTSLVNRIHKQDNTRECRVLAHFISRDQFST